MNWGPSNWRLAGLLILAFLTSLIPIRPTYFGFLPLASAQAGLAYVITGLLLGTLKFTVREIDQYEPESPLAAKRVNEQIKLTATFVNILAAAVVSVVTLSELARSHTPDFTFMVVFGSIAVMIHVAARSLMGRLKDESPPIP